VRTSFFHSGRDSLAQFAHILTHRKARLRSIRFRHQRSHHG
jgi:hypothetical protein